MYIYRQSPRCNSSKDLFAQPSATPCCSPPPDEHDGDSTDAPGSSGGSGCCAQERQRHWRTRKSARRGLGLR